MDNRLCISPKEVDEFDLAIAVACMLQSEERIEHRIPRDAQVKEFAVPSYFYRPRDRCLVVSFDHGWYPFLDSTRGFNQGPQRWHIPKTSELIVRIAKAMQADERKRRSHGIPGGRTFLHSTGAIGPENVSLLTWTLEKPSAFLREK